MKAFGSGSDPGSLFQSASMKATSCSCCGQIKPCFLSDGNSGRKLNNSQQRQELTTVPSKRAFKVFRLACENVGIEVGCSLYIASLTEGSRDVVLPF